MPLNPDIIENFRFLTLEIRKELEETVRCIEESDLLSSSQLSNSGDYADNLRNLITRKSYKLILSSDKTDKRLIDFTIAINTIATNLERIGDFCENVVRQLEYLNDKDFLKNYDYNSYFKVIFEALDEMCGAMVDSDIDTAIRICESEIKLDAMYKRDLDNILKQLHIHQNNSGDLVTALFIFRYLERIGDSLLNIGEAIISATVGTKLKISHYLSLRESYKANNFELEKLGGETKSGCNIEKLITGNEDDGASEVVIKEGKASKIEEEKQKLETWQTIFPGLAPRVVEYKPQGENALILIEFIRGRNYQELLIGSDSAILSRSTDELINTMKSVWNKTIIRNIISSDFISQLEKRLPDIIAVHPSLQINQKAIGGISHSNLESMLTKIRNLEAELICPFSVMIHGDLNNDNIIFNHKTGKIHLIDLHRSAQADYVQDVSVFLISNFRMPVFEQPIRDSLNNTNINFFYFARDFAKEHEDTSFEMRLTLGLARSFITSTRFILNENFALELFNRALYLMNKIMSLNPDEYHNYRLPQEVLCY